MNLHIKSSDDSNEMRWAGALNLYTVDVARTELLAHLAGKPGLDLDLSAVEICDAAGIQLLLAARRSAVELGKAFVISTPGVVVHQTAQLLGTDTSWFQSKNPDLT